MTNYSAIIKCLDELQQEMLSPSNQTIQVEALSHQHQMQTIEMIVRDKLPIPFSDVNGALPAGYEKYDMILDVDEIAEKYYECKYAGETGELGRPLLYYAHKRMQTYPPFMREAKWSPDETGVAPWRDITPTSDFKIDESFCSKVIVGFAAFYASKLPAYDWGKESEKRGEFLRKCYNDYIEEATTSIRELITTNLPLALTDNKLDILTWCCFVAAEHRYGYVEPETDRRLFHGDLTIQRDEFMSLLSSIVMGKLFDEICVHRGNTSDGETCKEEIDAQLSDLRQIKESLENENKALKEKVVQLAELQNRIKHLEAENKELRDKLPAEKNVDVELVAEKLVAGGIFTETGFAKQFIKVIMRLDDIDTAAKILEMKRAGTINLEKKVKKLHEILWQNKLYKKGYGNLTDQLRK